MELIYTEIALAPRKASRSRLARNTDPSTSHDAAARAERFKATHEGRILAAINLWCIEDDCFPVSRHGCTPPDIADESGLTIHAVGKRLKAMQETGLIELVQIGGEDLIRDGFRVWRAIGEAK